MVQDSEQVIKLYEDVLQEKCCFPNYFFHGPSGKTNASIITRYVIEEKAQWERADICSKLSRNVLASYRLLGMTKLYFGGSVFQVVNNAYPGEFCPWELRRARKFVFSGPEGRENARRAVTWLITEKLQSPKGTYGRITRQDFKQHDLSNMLDHLYEGCITAAIQDAGLDSRHPWEICRVPHGYWDGPDGYKHAVTAINWLISDKLHFSLADIPSIRASHFKQHGLHNMLKHVFHGSPFQAVDAVYPGCFKPWEFASSGNGFWQGNSGLAHAKEAMRWLITEKLHTSVKDLPTHIPVKVFQKYGLKYMLDEVFHGSVRDALNTLEQL